MIKNTKLYIFLVILLVTYFAWTFYKDYRASMFVKNKSKCISSGGSGITSDESGFMGPKYYCSCFLADNHQGKDYNYSFRLNKNRFECIDCAADVQCGENAECRQGICYK